MTEGQEETAGSDGYMLIILNVVMLSWIYTYIKTHQIVHLCEVYCTSLIPQ